MVGTSRKDSTKDEVRTSTLGYVKALRKAGHEPRQGSAMSAWGAPSPRSRPAGVEVSLDKADAVIEGLRFFLRFALSNPRANWQSSTRSGACVAPRSCCNTRSAGALRYCPNMGCRAGACPGQAVLPWREAALQANWDTITIASGWKSAPLE